MKSGKRLLSPLLVAVLFTAVAVPAAAAGTQYVVLPGDCLWSIADRQLGSGLRWKEIYEANRGTVKDPNLIYAGQTLTLPADPAAGYPAEVDILGLERTCVRGDYSSDEVYANFRPIVLGNIAPGVLYRTSSPINPALNRNTYADDLLRRAGVRTVVNLADSRAVMEGHAGYAGSYYATLDVIPLDMSTFMYSEESKAALKAGLEFMLEHEGPYAFHCTEGKDRSGYFAMLLEALMGATAEEITADYMLSFENYYHVEKGSEAWTLIAGNHIVRDLLRLTGAADASALAGADLTAAAACYLTDVIGLTAGQVAALRACLSAPAGG